MILFILHKLTFYLKQSPSQKKDHLCFKHRSLTYKIILLFRISIPFSHSDFNLRILMENYIVYIYIQKKPRKVLL